MQFRLESLNERDGGGRESSLSPTLTGHAAQVDFLKFQVPFTYIDSYEYDAHFKCNA